MRANLRPTALGFAIAIAATACTGRDATPTDATPSPATVAAPATMAMPPAATVAPAPSTTVMPAPATTTMTDAGPRPAEGAITFAGFGPAHWGASEEQVRQAWGKDLDGAPSEPNGCYYLFPAPRTEGGYRFAFLVEGGRFSRLDVRVPDIAAPGGGRVGMTTAQIHDLYKGVAEQKHKYVEGAMNLRAMDPDGGPGIAVFETDAGGKVTAWRVGVPPQVDYVEGCS